MRILFVMKKQLDVAVDRTVRFEMIRALESLGHEVRLMVGYRDRPEDFGMGDRLIYITAPTVPGLFHAGFVRGVRRRLPALVAEWDPGAVILDAWTVRAGTALRGASGAGRPRVVMDVRTLPVQLEGLRRAPTEALFRRGIRAAGRICDCVSAITVPMRDQLVSDWGLDPDVPSCVWTSGVDAARFDASRFTPSQRADLRDKLGLGESFVAIYHGTITASRGVPDLVRAISILRGEGADVRLLLVGRGSDVREVLSVAEETGVRDRVAFPGVVPYEEIPAYLACADVGVLPFPDLPGWRVSSPIKLFEYLAMSLPVVVTDIVAHRDVLGSSAAASYAEGPSPAALAAALRSVDAMGVARRAEAGAEGRSIALERFSWRAQAELLVKCLEGLGS